MGSVLGMLAGVVVVLAIQFTIGNPFIWMFDKYDEWKWERSYKKCLKNPCENNWYCKDCGEVNCEC